MTWIISGIVVWIWLIVQTVRTIAKATHTVPLAPVIPIRREDRSGAP